MRAIQMEPVEDICWESIGTMRETISMGTNVRGQTQKLEQAQVSLVELYLEDKELRWQFAERTLEVSASQGHKGKMKWLKMQLREAKDTIVQMREAQRALKEKKTCFLDSRDSN